MKTMKTTLLAMTCGGALALTQLFTAVPPAAAYDPTWGAKDPYVYDDPDASPSCAAILVKDCEICYLKDAQYYDDGKTICTYDCKPRTDKDGCKEQFDTNGWNSGYGF